MSVHDNSTEQRGITDYVDDADGGGEQHTDTREVCPLCGYDLTRTPLHKHLPHCDDPEGDYQDA